MRLDDLNKVVFLFFTRGVVSSYFFVNKKEVYSSCWQGVWAQK